MKRSFLTIFLLCTLALVTSAVAAPLITEWKGNALQYREGELLVKFKPGVSAEVQEVQALSVGAERIKTFKNIGVQHLRLPKGMSVEEGIQMYKANSDVEYAEPNYIIRADGTPNDTYFDTLWGLNNTGQTSGTVDADIDAPEAWDIQTGSSSVVVAVMDSGIDYNHPDLTANIWQNAGESNCSDNIDNDVNGFKDDCMGWDFVDGDNDPMDVAGHGTHVAGTIGAMGNDAYGVSGVSWNVSLMDVRVLNAYGSGFTSDIIAGINYAVQNGADVVNCSWGGPNYSQALKDAIDKYPGTLFVCASGNDGNDTDSVGHYPSGFQSANIISVAATDDDDKLASFSNYGALSVDVGAPGVSINSTIPGRQTIWSDNFNDGSLSDWTSGGTNNTWGLTTVFSNSPAWSLADSPGAGIYYSNNTDSWVRPTTAINLTGKSGCKLDYRMKFDLESEFDFLCVEASNSSTPATFSPLGEAHSAIGLPCWTYTTIGSTLYPFSEDLGAYDGQSAVYIRFHLTSDESVIRDGVYIDDVTITCAQDGAYSETEYEMMSGTSMAAPHVSGVAALLIANIPTLTALDVKNVLIGTIDPLVSLNGKTVSGGRVNAYNALSVDPAALPPVAPSNLKASKASKTSVSLTWMDNSTAEEGFYIERKDGGLGSFVEIATAIVNTTSYTDTGLTTGVTYTYRVRAYNANGPSPYSNEASATPKKSSSSGGGSGGSFIPGCFIATAAYGSPMAEEVKLLRRFRDEQLMHTAMGRKFVKLYYTYSPRAARVIARHPILRRATRAALYPVVFSVKHPLGAGGIMLSLLVMSGSVLMISRKKGRNSCDA